MEVGQDKLIEAVFWIEPTRSETNFVYQSSKVLWHCPEDVSHITKVFRDIPLFCFPDMNDVRLEKAETVKSNQFIFTLTNKDGTRYYGICFRQLFRGISRRFDVSRRPKHCLCIISRHPYFALFKSISSEIYSIGLMEYYPSQCKNFVNQIVQSVANSNLPAFTLNQISPFRPGTASANAFPNLDFHWQLPKKGNTFFKDTLIHPLFVNLGVDRFFKLFSAILLEKRIVFIANDIDNLTSSILASIAMIHPFRWHHIFITILPPKLVNYLSAPMPYIIGLQRSTLPEVKRETLGQVLLVDLDSGDVGPAGGLEIFDLVGDSGNTLKLASESLDRVRAGLSSVFLGKSNNDADNAQKDIMPMIVLDMKSVLTSKPGGGSIQSVASGLLRGLPGTAKSTSEAKAQWALESEKTVRDCLASFFVFLFADVDEFWVNNPNVASKGDFRSNFDAKAYLYRRNQNGMSKLLQEFIDQFLHSQMFEKFCEEKFKRNAANPNEYANRRASASSASISSFHSTNSNELILENDDTFESAVMELKYSQKAVNAINVKQAVTSRTLLNISDSSNTSSNGGKINTVAFHPSVLQYTANLGNENEYFSYETGDFVQTNSSRARTNVVLLEKILHDSYHSEHLRRICNTISYRLDAGKAAGCRGSAGVNSIKALSLLRILLVQGPMQVITFGLDFIPLLRSFLSDVCKKKNKSYVASQALDFMASGPVINPLLSVLQTLSLLVDHKKLMIQRTMHLVKQNTEKQQSNSSGTFSLSSQPRKDLFVSTGKESYAAKKFPVFSQLHNQFNSAKLSSINSNVLRVTIPEKAHAEKEDDDNDQLGELPPGLDEKANISPTTSVKLSAIPPPRTQSVDNRVSISPLRNSSEEGNGKLNPSTKNSIQPTLSTGTVPRNTNASATKEVNLLEFSTDETAKYRMKNIDTGEIMDIREYEKNYDKLYKKSAFLPPPPKDNKPIRRAPGSSQTNSNSPPPTDPFATFPAPVPSRSPVPAPAQAKTPPPAFDPWANNTQPPANLTHPDPFASQTTSILAFTPSTPSQYPPQQNLGFPPSAPSNQFTPSYNTNQSQPIQTSNPVYRANPPQNANVYATRPPPTDPFADLVSQAANNASNKR